MKKTLIILIILISNFVESQNYAKSFAQSYQDKDYVKAEFYIDKWKDELLRFNDTISTNYADCIYWKAYLNKEKKFAEKDFLTALKIYDKHYGKISKIYSSALETVANYYLFQIKNYEIAISLLEELSNIKNQLYGENSNEFISNLRILGFAFSQNNNRKKSEFYLLNAVKLCEKYKILNNFEYYTSLLSLSQNYSYQAEYDLAEIYYLKLLNSASKYKEEYSSIYLDAIQSLAQNYYNKGDIANSELYYKKLVDESKNNNNDKELLKVKIKMCNFYLELKNNLKAQESLDEIESLYQSVGKKIKQFDIIHSLYFLINKNYYCDIKKYSKALDYSIKLVEYLKLDPVFGVTSNGYLRELASLSSIYKNAEDLKNAEKYYLESYNGLAPNLGNNPYNDAIFLLGIANLYERLNQFDKAEIFYKKGIVMFDKNPTLKNTSNYINYLYFISIFYFNNQNYIKSIEYIEEINLKNKLYINNVINVLSEDELAHSQISQGMNNLPLSILFAKNTLTRDIEDLRTNTFETNLLLKNLSLRNQQRIKSSIQKSGDIKLQSKYERFIANKRQIHKLEELPTDNLPTTYEQLITETEQLEKELTRQTASFADAKNALSINLKQVQEKLQPKELAIELVAFNYYNKKWTDSIVYAAFVVGKNFKTPKYIPLFEQKQLVGLLVKDSIGISKQYTNKAISDLFFKPLAKELQDIKTIYLAPAGLGYQIDFAALPIGNTTLGEKYKVHILGASSEIVNYKAAQLDKNTGLELLLYGAIDYDKIPEKKEKDAVENKNRNDFKALATRSGSNGFNYLKGTENEINQIQQSGQANGFKATIIDDRKASKESIKQLDGRTMPYVLHLATHGFFFENPKTILPELKTNETQHNKNVTAEDPMLRSGLIFAGANKFWGKPITAEIADNGVLTASEISNLDLSACQLVVLSACETGLGDINGSDGVFGLQRAFKMAGVKNIIMSMWKVPDAQTAQLFAIFYQSCFAGKSIHEAFQIAQAEMKQKYTPYYWAGFVLME